MKNYVLGREQGQKISIRQHLRQLKSHTVTPHILPPTNKLTASPGLPEEPMKKFQKESFRERQVDLPADPYCHFTRQTEPYKQTSVVSQRNSSNFHDRSTLPTTATTPSHQY